MLAFRENPIAMNTIWKGLLAIVQGIVAVAVVSTAVTLLMLLSTRIHSDWAWRFSMFLTVFGVGFTHLVAVFMHRGHPFYRFDFIGMLLVPLTTPFVAVFTLHSALIYSYGCSLSRPDEYFLMFLWSLGVCFIGIPSVWRLFWLYTAPLSTEQGGIFSRPDEPKFRSTSLPPK